jgi:cell division protein FtsN
MNMNQAPVKNWQSPLDQRGGTFLGLILGVLLGLGGALVVAIYVTKMPVPFINKGQPRNADQDAAETKKNKDWDPNTPLYGKNPAKPNASASGAVSGATESAKPDATTTAAKPLVAASATKPSPATSPASAAKPTLAASASKPAASAKPGDDPLGDLAKSKAASTAPGVDPFMYFVQAGAYRTPEDAETQKAKLGMLGFEGKVTEREQSGRTVFRVRVGPFDKKDDADKAKEKLDGSGLDTALVRVQR